MPSEMITSQCHRLQGRRSILWGMFVLLAAFPLDSTALLLITFIASKLLCSSPRCSDYTHLFAIVPAW